MPSRLPKTSRRYSARMAMMSRSSCSTGKAASRRLREPVATTAARRIVVGGGDGTVSFAAAAAAKDGRDARHPAARHDESLCPLARPAARNAGGGRGDCRRRGRPRRHRRGQRQLLRSSRHARTACPHDPDARADDLCVAARQALGERQGLVDSVPQSAKPRRADPCRREGLSPADGRHPRHQQSARRGASSLRRRSA